MKMNVLKKEEADSDGVPEGPKSEFWPFWDTRVCSRRAILEKYIKEILYYL